MAPFNLWYCGKAFSRACRADYLFWWARRLLAWARHGFDPWYAFMAILAARQALAHLVGFAATLVHEFGHRTLAIIIINNNNHCKPLVITPLSLYTRPVGCCFFWSDAAFYSRMLATYGLPWPENPDGPYTEDAFEIPFDAYEGSSCRDQFVAAAQHCPLLRLSRYSDLRVRVSEPCSPTLRTVDSFLPYADRRLCAQ